MWWVAVRWVGVRPLDRKLVPRVIRTVQTQLRRLSM